MRAGGCSALDLPERIPSLPPCLAPRALRAARPRDGRSQPLQLLGSLLGSSALGGRRAVAAACVMLAAAALAGGARRGASARERSNAQPTRKERERSKQQKQSSGRRGREHHGGFKMSDVPGASLRRRKTGGGELDEYL